jgi:hypothetical protein
LALLRLGSQKRFSDCVLCQQTLSVTITSRGITPQHVLVGMENGQIFKLNRGYIDPRQPDKPLTPLEQECVVSYTWRT